MRLLTATLVVVSQVIIAIILCGILSTLRFFWVEQCLLKCFPLPSEIALFFSHGVGLLLHIAPVFVTSFLLGLIIVYHLKKRKVPEGIVPLIFAVAFFQIAVGFFCLFALILISYM